jgi:molybdenum cofactor cytidylyltransferase
MGRPKALLPWRRGTFLSGAIQVLNNFSDLVIVVAGSIAPEVLPVADANAAYLVRNPQPERGQFSSLQMGLQEVLNRGRDAAIITLVDRPPARPETIDYLQRQFLSFVEQDMWAVVPEFEGAHGHPIVVGREMIGAFLAAPSTSTAREVIHAHQSRVAYVPVKDPFVTMNIDTPQDYERLIAFPETSVTR